MAEFVVKPVEGYRMHRNKLLVAPLYDSDSVLGIVIPDAYKNEWTCHGYVVAAGWNTGFEYPDHVFFKSYKDRHLERLKINGFEYFVLNKNQLVGSLREANFVPMDGVALVRPHWDSAFEDKRSNLILLDPSTFEGKGRPPLYGEVIALGANCNEVSLGQKVMIPPKGGTEIALVHENLYAIEESLILATIE